MTSTGADSKLFEEVIRELLGQGLSVRFQARGASMSPAIRDGEIVRSYSRNREQITKGRYRLNKI